MAAEVSEDGNPATAATFDLRAGGEPPPVGARYDRFVVEEVLGAGGMGVVMAAVDPELGRRVALKVLRPDLASALDQGRLVREAQAMARLSHPNVVTVYDVGRAGDNVFIAMELVDGQTLRGWLRQRPRSWREVVTVFVAAGRGLAAAHEAGLVHRDFKPDNVLVGRDGRPRVGDFGIVATGVRPDPDALGPAQLDTALTVRGSA
ncbi:MAG TPA: serine/threonine-protein kinase, partial [Kofleriaceae bacterium]|nr:serine/threonine-protein kinase [Kofleriaceae bacterium]